MITELPSLTPLHKKLCLLDFYKELKDDYANIKEDLERRNENKDDELPQVNDDGTLKEVSLNYTSSAHYIDEWEKLFMLEIKAQILRSAISEKKDPETYYLKGGELDNPFYIMTLEPKETCGVIYKVYDLVLFTFEHPDTRQNTNLLTIVEYFGAEALKLKTVITEGTEKYNLLLEYFEEDSVWHVQNICNLATIHREYQALYSVGDLMLKEYLLTPDKKIKEGEMNGTTYFIIPSELDICLKRRYNSSQYKAIQSSLKKEGITLIQGPPGTGKTFTILGILSVLLNSTSETNVQLSKNAKNKLKQAKLNIEKRDKNDISSSSSDEDGRQFAKKDIPSSMPWLCRGFRDYRDQDRTEIEFSLERHLVFPIAMQTDQTLKLPEMKPDVHAKPQKILICAPSNAAIDQIIRLVLAKGLYSPDGGALNPSIVRIGPNFHSDLKHISIESMIETELQAEDSKNTQAEIKNRILRRTKLICSTLSVAGSKMLLNSGIIFDTVIIDEAAQAVELSTLIPLKYKCRRLIMIGDPKQLPATIFSKTCEKYKYDRSLFQRLQMNGEKVILLQQQYRMHPIISKIISDSFYEGKVKNYDEILDLIGEPEQYNDERLQPLMFYNVRGYEEFENNSYINKEEAKFIVLLIQYIQKTFPSINLKTIGVISPYSSQVKLIRDGLNSTSSKLADVEVHTVDGFQGREKDIILFSCVRSERPPTEPRSYTIGFLRDKRRMNVSLSRARLSLIVVGNTQKMYTSRKWKKLIDYSYGLESLYDMYGNGKLRAPNKEVKQCLVTELTGYV